jgi:hypothetical protein
VRALERELLAHRLSHETIDAVVDAYGRPARRMLAAWLREGLLTGDAEAKAFRPTRDGSWFIGNMIGEARALESARARESVPVAVECAP